MPKVQAPRRVKLPALKKLDDWRIVERRPVGVHEGKMLVWLLLVGDDGNTAWKPYYLADDGITVLEEPAFCPLPGSQYLFLSSPIFETLYAGNRGGGKTDSLLLSFAAGVGRGYGKGYRGILFRREFGDLDDVVRKVDTLFPHIWGDHFRFLKSKSEYTCTWDTGEALLLRNLPNEDAYSEYHGHCLDEGDVLTPTGWIDIRDLKAGNLVYTFDEDGEMMASVIEQTHSQRYEGTLIRRKGDGLYMSFTPAHKLPVMQPDGRSELRAYEDLGGHADIRRSIVKWEGSSAADFIAEHAKTLKGVSAADYLAFVGWWLACGSIVGRDRILKCQTAKALARLRRSLENTSIPYLPRKDGVTLGRMFSAHLDRMQEVPRPLLDAPADVLRVLLDGLIGGAGLWRSASTDAVFRTRNRALSDNVCEIGVKLGFNVLERTSRLGSAGKSAMYSVTLTPGKPARLKTGRGDAGTSNITAVPFKGDVYCIGVPLTHTFIVRQRGCVWLSGNSYAWIGFEELTQWPNDKAYRLMFSCARPPAPGVPVIGVRATTNPYGVGHGWVKKRFQLPQGFGKVIRLPGQDPRVAIQSDLRENFVLLHGDPNYPNRIRNAASNPAQARAWLLGDWSVTTGGMFDDIWNPQVHVVPNIVPRAFPFGWRMDRSYDHGQARPFSCLWWAESNGEPIYLPDGRVIGQIPGDIVLWAEWYGTTGEPDVGVRMSARQIANGIRERQNDWGVAHRVRPGPVDNQIYEKDSRGTNRSPADDMEDVGITWTLSDKSAGSRIRGYQMIRGRLSAAIPSVDGTRDYPGLFVCERNVHWLEIVPSAPRDTQNQDELPKNFEDHAIDATRYRLSSENTLPWQRGF